MISLPTSFRADEPGRVKAALRSNAVQRRDALGFDLVIEGSRLHCVNHPGFDARLVHIALVGAPAAWAATHRLFIVNDVNRWEIAGSYQIARCVKVPGRRSLSVDNGHGWKAISAKAGVAVSNPCRGTEKFAAHMGIYA
jgi:hypothetical protein